MNEAASQGPIDDNRASSFIEASKLADFGLLPNALVRKAGIEGIPRLKRPKWVAQCSDKVTDALFPKIGDASAFEAKGVNYEGGFALGLIEGGAMRLGEAFDKFGKLPMMREPTEEEVISGFTNLFGESGVWLAAVFKDGGVSFFEKIEKAVEALNIGERADFLLGQSEALRMVAGDNLKNDATDIYLFMLVFWRVVAGLDSVDQLYKVLLKVLGQNLVGSDPKRVSQICRRVGLRYRRRGRPRKQLQ